MLPMLLFIELRALAEIWFAANGIKTWAGETREIGETRENGAFFFFSKPATAGVSFKSTKKFTAREGAGEGSLIIEVDKKE